MTLQSIYVWSVQYPDYHERMQAMAIPQNVYNAFKNADKLELTPKTLA